MSAMPPFKLTRPTDAPPASSALPTVQPSAAPPPAPTPNNSAVINPTWQTAINKAHALFQQKNKRPPNDGEMRAMEEQQGMPAKFTTADKVKNATPEQMAQSTAAGNAAASAAPPIRKGGKPAGYQGTGPGGKSLLATLPRNSTPSAAPMFDPATGAAQAGMINDANNGITSRGGGTVTTQGGGIITNQPGGTKSLSSPYGSGSVTFAPAGTKPPGDPNLRAMTAAIKARQAQGIYTPDNPTVARAAPPSTAPISPTLAQPGTGNPQPGTSAPPIPIDQNIAQARSATNVMQAVNQKWAQANAPAPQTIQGIQTAKPAFMTAAPPLAQPGTPAPPVSASSSLPASKPSAAPSFLGGIARNAAQTFGGSPIGQELKSMAGEVQTGINVAHTLNRGIVETSKQGVKGGIKIIAAAALRNPNFRGSQAANYLERKIPSAAPPRPPMGLLSGR